MPGQWPLDRPCLVPGRHAYTKNPSADFSRPESWRQARSAAFPGFRRRGWTDSAARTASRHPERRDSGCDSLLHRLLQKLLQTWLTRWCKRVVTLSFAVTPAGGPRNGRRPEARGSHPAHRQAVGGVSVTGRQPAQRASGWTVRVLTLPGHPFLSFSARAHESLDAGCPSRKLCRPVCCTLALLDDILLLSAV